MMHRTVFLGIMFVVMAGEGLAEESAVEAAISDESVQLRILLSGYGAGNSDELGLGLLLNESRDIVATGHYYFEPDELQSRSLTVKAGPIAYAALLSTENTDVFSVALGAEVRLELLRRQGIFVVAQAAYAPDIMSFGAADNLMDLAARIELPLTDRVIGFIGYRTFEIELLNSSREIEESAHLGIRYRF